MMRPGYFQRVRDHGPIRTPLWHMFARVTPTGLHVSRCGVKAAIQNIETTNAVPNNGRLCEFCPWADSEPREDEG